MNKAVIRERLNLLKGWVEKRWAALSARKQRRFVMQLFAVYAAVTILVIAYTFYRSGRKSDAVIDHISNPIPVKKQRAAPGTINVTDTTNQNPTYGK